MNRSQRNWTRALALCMALLVVGCASDANEVSCHNDLVSRPSDTTGLTITYSGEGIELEVLNPDGFVQVPVSETDITVDTGPAKLADMGSLTPGTYLIHMRDGVGTRSFFTFQAIVAVRQITQVRLICQ